MNSKASIDKLNHEGDVMEGINLWGLVIVVTLLSLGIGSLYLQAQNARRQHRIPAGGNAPPAPPPGGAGHGHAPDGTGDGAGENNNRWYQGIPTTGWIVIGILILALLGGLWNYQGTIFSIEGFLWVAVLIVLGTAVYGWTRSGGTGAKVIGSIVMICLLLLVGAFAIFGEKTPAKIQDARAAINKMVSEGPSPAKGVSSTPAVTQATAKWEKTAEDGSLPVGVWSEWISIDLDCRHRFFLDEKVEAKWRDDFGKEHQLLPGSKIDQVQAVQFKPLVPGLKSYPYKKICT